MSTTVSETGTNIIFNVNFASRLFKTATVNGFITSYKHILDRFAHSSEADECKIEDIKAIDEANYVKLTRNSDITVRQFDDQDMTLHQIFENIVINSPTRTAVVSEDIELTYQELNERANQLAHYIRSLANIKPDDLIALVLDKSELMVVSIIAVWKTGSAYVPIDPTIPKERMQFILEDTSSRIVITNHVYGATLQGIAANFRILEIDCPLTNMELKQYSSSNCNSDAHEDNLAYVIYTSGTTGRPKGVMVEHRQVVNFRNSLVMDHFPASWQQQQQAILCLSNYVFDFSIE